MPARLLLAEDDAILREDLKEELTRQGYLVVGETEDGESAVRLARELRPDLVIMCIRMPIMDGLTAAEILSHEHIAPVMLVTAMSDDELIERAGMAGVVMYVTKPWRESDLRPAIEMALARYAEQQRLNDRIHDLDEALATRKVVERAKGMLQQRGTDRAGSFPPNHEALNEPTQVDAHGRRGNLARPLHHARVDQQCQRAAGARYRQACD